MAGGWMRRNMDETEAERGRWVQTFSESSRSKWHLMRSVRVGPSSWWNKSADPVELVVTACGQRLGGEAKMVQGLGNVPPRATTCNTCVDVARFEALSVDMTVEFENAHS